MAHLAAARGVLRRLPARSGLLPSHEALAANSLGRRGLTTPLVAAALLLAMCGLALIVDRIWLDTARWELIAAAEAAALSAARELASDELLKSAPDRETMHDRARQSALDTAQENRVAGTALSLDTNPGGDLLLSRMDANPESGVTELVEDNDEPTHVVVTAHRTRARNNPVALFIGEVTGTPFGDVATRVAAGVDNAVVGMRPLDGASIPVLPLAIWWFDPSGQRQDTWKTAIENRRGSDRFGYDSDTGTVTHQADGIPELTLSTQLRGGPLGTGNTLLLDIGSQFDADRLDQQIEHGLTAEDLQSWKGEFRRATLTAPLEIPAVAELLRQEALALRSILGQPRVCCLFQGAIPNTRGDRLTALCFEFVGIRVLEVDCGHNGSCQMVVQPTVVTSRSVQTGAAEPNRYLYRLNIVQ
jgi:Flp pilus assembly protein TadG